MSQYVFELVYYLEIFLWEQHNLQCIDNESLQDDILTTITCKAVLKSLLNEVLF